MCDGFFLFESSLCIPLKDPPSTRVNVLNSAETCDLLKGIIIVVCLYLMNVVDMPMIYHIIKSQSVIKLYIIFNMLEVSCFQWSASFVLFCCFKY